MTDSILPLTPFKVFLPFEQDGPRTKLELQTKTAGTLWPPFAFLCSWANASLISSLFTASFRNKKARFVHSHIHLAITGECFTHSLHSRECIHSLHARRRESWPLRPKRMSRHRDWRGKILGHSDLQVWKRRQWPNVQNWTVNVPSYLGKEALKSSRRKRGLVEPPLTAMAQVFAFLTV